MNYLGFCSSTVLRISFSVLLHFRALKCNSLIPWGCLQNIACLSFWSMSYSICIIAMFLQIIIHILYDIFAQVSMSNHPKIKNNFLKYFYVLGKDILLIFNKNRSSRLWDKKKRVPNIEIKFLRGQTIQILNDSKTLSD